MQPSALAYVPSLTGIHRGRASGGGGRWGEAGRSGKGPEAARDRRQQHSGSTADAAVVAGGALPKYAAPPPDPGPSGETGVAAAGAAAAAVEGGTSV